MTGQDVSVEAVRAAIRAAGAGWEAGVTSVSELSPQERRVRLGVRPRPEEGSLDDIVRRGAERLAGERPEAREVGAPAAHDWRNVGGKNFITPVRDQGNCGSCVAFGTAATIEGTARVQGNNPALAIDLSEAQLFYCYGRTQGVTCDTGWMPEHALEFARTKGVTDEAHYPYVARDSGCNVKEGWEGALTKISGSRDLTGKAAEMKEWLATKGPLSACLVVYADFYSYRGGVYRHVTGGQEGGHCVCIVGYDDAAGAWICKNSWNTGFGEGGFFRIAYGECAIDTWRVHAVEGVEDTGWRNGVRVLGLWVSDAERNAWAYLDGIGWRRLAFDNDNVLLSLLTDLAAAKLGKLPANVYVEQGVVRQVYVF
ncbi:hypothetical protein DAETH_41880 (plasmid) [Deinococcus aetherius]|uniref:Peptidase C1A papain C-terminal domain-containing protein n=1 Tax=Deinococcus aetherius TaxID=200252 RepID=A0ABN6RQM0_9DEIO|nr:C1 family peptidase [Deinococcus aetherius]BDP44219.1 hypothetical protein DAETH_41880 [Deinococcus aetherius]